MAKVDKFDHKKTYKPNLQAWINALQTGYFHLKHKTVWSEFNLATNQLILSGANISGDNLKKFFENVAARYPGTGTRGAKDNGKSNAGRHISALYKLCVFEKIN